jgi:hypothetical protein
MNITKCKTLTASAVVGLNRDYTDKIISNAELKEAILNTQRRIKDPEGVTLSVKLTECEILFLGQDEPSVTLDFIQYPKFPYEEEVWTNAVVQFIKNIMAELEQNRTVIVFPETTLMLENSDRIDPKIKIQ